MLTVCKGYVAIAVATTYAAAPCCSAGLLLLGNLTGSTMLALNFASLGRLDLRYTFPRIHWFAELGKMPGS